MFSTSASQIDRTPPEPAKRNFKLVAGRPRVLRETWPDLNKPGLGIRTLEVMLCVGAGDSNAEIGRRLGMSQSTVRYHVAKGARALASDDGARPIVIAVLDDDAPMREAMIALIDSYGFQTVAFESGEAFLDYAVGNQPACLVTDLVMPAMSGLELQDEMRRRGIDIPMIMISAYANARVRERALDAGALGFLQKPVNDAELLNLLWLANAPPDDPTAHAEG